MAAGRFPESLFRHSAHREIPKIMVGEPGNFHSIWVMVVMMKDDDGDVIGFHPETSIYK